MSVLALKSNHADLRHPEQQYLDLLRTVLESGVKIWDEWADENGDLGPVYGSQWRSWPDGRGGTIDQITNVVEAIRTKPDSRRHIVMAWNPAEVDEMALP